MVCAHRGADTLLLIVCVQPVPLHFQPVCLTLLPLQHDQYVLPYCVPCRCSQCLESDLDRANSKKWPAEIPDHTCRQQ